jgi:hypothetical protein
MDNCLKCIKISNHFYNIWNTQDIISKEVGKGIATVNDVVNSAEKGQLSIFGQNFKPLLYNIWNTQQSIADILGVPKMTISDVIEKYEKGHLSNFVQNFKPLLQHLEHAKSKTIKKHLPKLISKCQMETQSRSPAGLTKNSILLSSNQLQ